MQSRWKDALWALAFVPLSVLYTWPLAARLTTHLAGNRGDAWQNLWNVVWLHRAVAEGRSPLWTDALWHPHGVTLAFQTFDWPDAVLGALLLNVLEPWTVYNLLVLGTFAFSGASMFVLSRGLGASAPASFLAGCAYTFSTYHFGHAIGHLHIVAMQWVPLFVLALWRLLETGRARWAAVGAITLALSALASWYYLLGAFFIAVPVALTRLWPLRGRALSRALLLSAAMCAGFLVLVSPIAGPMLRERAAEPVAGAHDARTFSADIESFVVPNAAQALSRWTDRHRQWTGNGAENATYLGAVLVLLVLAGAWLRVPRVRVYLAVALLGIVLSLGPALHVGGRIVTGDWLPYAQLERVFPLLGFAGVPVRLAFAATFALAAALAPSLDAIARRWGWKAALPLGVLALAEHVPNAFVTSTFPSPAPMRAWASDPQPFAVLDATRDMRHLWHQVLHGHPIVGGYLTRTPERLERALEADPVAGPLMAWDAPRRTEPVRFDALDLDFREPVTEGAESTRFTLELRGTLQVPADGTYRFFVTSDDSAELFIGRTRVVDNRGIHPARERDGETTLRAGAHPIRMRYRQYTGAALLRVEWEGPQVPRAVLPVAMEGTATFGRRDIRLPRDEALDHLRAQRIRYVVVDRRESRHALETQLGLQPAWDGDGVRIYEVPTR